MQEDPRKSLGFIFFFYDVYYIFLAGNLKENKTGTDLLRGEKKNQSFFGSSMQLTRSITNQPKKKETAVRHCMYLENTN